MSQTATGLRQSVPYIDDIFEELGQLLGAHGSEQLDHTLSISMAPAPANNPHGAAVYIRITKVRPNVRSTVPDTDIAYYLVRDAGCKLVRCNHQYEPLA